MSLKLFAQPVPKVSMSPQESNAPPGSRIRTRSPVSLRLHGRHLNELKGQAEGPGGRSQALQSVESYAVVRTEVRLGNQACPIRHRIACAAGLAAIRRRSALSGSPARTGRDSA